MRIFGEFTPISVHVEYHFIFSLNMWMHFFQISFDHAFRIFFKKNFAHDLFFLWVRLNNVRHSPSQVWFSNQERPKNGFQIIFRTGICSVIQLTFKKKCSSDPTDKSNYNVSRVHNKKLSYWTFLRAICLAAISQK